MTDRATDASTQPTQPTRSTGPGAGIALPDLAGDLGRLTLGLVSIPSASGSEGPLADAVQAALEEHPHLEVLRHGDTVVARTHLDRDERVIVAGHLDTVPASRRTGNVPGRLETREGRSVVWGAVAST